MSSIRTWFQKFFPSNPFRSPVKEPLGRWKIDYCTNKINRKVDQANEDHCGPCGSFVVMHPTKEGKPEIHSEQQKEPLRITI